MTAARLSPSPRLRPSPRPRPRLSPRPRPRLSEPNCAYGYALAAPNARSGARRYVPDRAFGHVREGVRR